MYEAEDGGGGLGEFKGERKKEGRREKEEGGGAEDLNVPVKVLVVETGMARRVRG